SASARGPRTSRCRSHRRSSRRIPCRWRSRSRAAAQVPSGRARRCTGRRPSTRVNLLIALTPLFTSAGGRRCRKRPSQDRSSIVRLETVGVRGLLQEGRMLRRALESIVSISLVAAAPVLAVADVQVTTCGASVPMNMTGFLGADLDCAASPGIGVSLGSGAALELRGFSLIGNPGATNADGVVCDGGCTVLGPGTIRDFSGNGVVSPGHLTITGATIQNIAGQGVRSVSATAAGVSISGTGTAMYSPPNDELTTSIIHVSDSTITNNGSGVTAAVVRVVNSTISNNASTAVSNTRVTIIGSHIDGNGQGVDAELISVQ